MHQHFVTQHEKIPCDICGEMYGSKVMPRHVQSKHTERQNMKFKCTFCGKGFAQGRNLKDHINIHTGEKPYICKFCGAAFSSVGNHGMHERTVHMGHKRDEKSNKK